MKEKKGKDKKNEEKTIAKKRRNWKITRKIIYDYVKREQNRNYKNENIIFHPKGICKRCLWN